MKQEYGLILVTLLVLVLPPLSSTGFAEAPEIVEMEGGQAKVTLVEGSAELFCKEPEAKRPMVRGDLLRHGDRVTMGEQARIELAMPDNSFLRFDEKTTFELLSVNYDQETKRRDIQMHAKLGKTWQRLPI